LLAWQDAGFRGHLTVEALAERHMIVRVLQDAIVQFHGIAGIVIAADDQSLARWQPIVGQSEGWHAVTAEEVLLGAIHLNSNVAPGCQVKCGSRCLPAQVTCPPDL
jgi:hypothetical protein